MNIRLISVPYDSGWYGERMGRGPLHLLEKGLKEDLAVRQQEVEVVEIQPGPGFVPEVAAAVAIQQQVREAVAAARQEGALPVVLAGNCNYAALGAMAALPRPTGVVWFDAHGDFNTPDTSPSGFLDGMALSVLTGSAWRGIHASLADFEPIAEASVVLAGARDVDPEEARRLRHSAITWIESQDVSAAAARGWRDAWTKRRPSLYLHIDLDVLDVSTARVNPFSCGGGLTLAELVAALAATGERYEVTAAAVTAYDPSVDDDGQALVAAKAVVAALIAAADG